MADPSIAQVRKAMNAVEAKWQFQLPDGFSRLYAYQERPFLITCEFFTLEEILNGLGRERGAMPQFVPFGSGLDGELFGLYVTPELCLGRLPVLALSEEGSLRPAASEFSSFLKTSILTGRCEAELDEEEPGDDTEEADARRDLSHALEIPENLLLGELPRNEAELFERLVNEDAQNAYGLLKLGCIVRGRNETERALDFYHRASEAAPWFGDCAYLAGDLYREGGRLDRAVQCYWSVISTPIALSTQSTEWDLGEDHPDADIYEISADALSQFRNHASADMLRDPIWRIIADEDPYDPEAREEFALMLQQKGDTAGAERELLNALHLCAGEPGAQPMRIYSSLHALYERNGRLRDAAFVEFDAQLMAE